MYNQTCQIKNLTYLIKLKNDDIIWLDQRVEFLEAQVYEFDRSYQTHLDCYDDLINSLIDGGYINEFEICY